MPCVHRIMRSAISWSLLASMCLPLSPARAAESAIVPLPAAFASAAAGGPEPPPQPGRLASDTDASTLHLAVLSGDGAVNILKKKVTVAPVVQVLDAGNRPVAGAVVTLTAPANGASVEFAHGTRSTMLVSDGEGKVKPAELTAVNTGSFVYRIRALYQEQEATGTIAQTNVTNANGASGQAAAPTATSGMPHWVYAALIGGAAAGAGIGIAVGMKGSNKTTSTPSTATIGSPGSATVGTGH